MVYLSLTLLLALLIGACQECTSGPATVTPAPVPPVARVVSDTDVAAAVVDNHDRLESLAALLQLGVCFSSREGFKAAAEVYCSALVDSYGAVLCTGSTQGLIVILPHVIADVL